MEMHKTGKVRILAVTTPARVPELPDVPTLQEAGLADFTSDTWNAISAPPKTPAAIVAKLNAAINDVLHAPDVKSHLGLLHLQAAGGSPQQMAETIRADIVRWGAVIRAANVTLE
jgi:tripartite-type tricarboxylate transporter receptor subunit TctC